MVEVVVKVLKKLNKNQAQNLVLKSVFKIMKIHKVQQENSITKNKINLEIEIVQDLSHHKKTNKKIINKKTKNNPKNQDLDQKI